MTSAAQSIHLWHLKGTLRWLKMTGVWDARRPAIDLPSYLGNIYLQEDWIGDLADVARYPVRNSWQKNLHKWNPSWMLHLWVSPCDALLLPGPYCHCSFSLPHTQKLRLDKFIWILDALQAPHHLSLPLNLRRTYAPEHWMLQCTIVAPCSSGHKENIWKPSRQTTHHQRVLHRDLYNKFEASIQASTSSLVHLHCYGVWWVREKDGKGYNFILKGTVINSGCERSILGPPSLVIPALFTRMSGAPYFSVTASDGLSQRPRTAKHNRSLWISVHSHVILHVMF